MILNFVRTADKVWNRKKSSAEPFETPSQQAKPTRPAGVWTAV